MLTDRAFSIFIYSERMPDALIATRGSKFCEICFSKRSMNFGISSFKGAGSFLRFNKCF